MPSRFVILAITLLLLFAQAPSWAETGRDLVVLLDNSGSMRAKDPQRLALLGLKRFADGLNQDDRLALIRFDHQVSKVMPLTRVDDEQRASFAEALDAFDYRGQYTRSPEALEQALYLLKEQGRADAVRGVLLITDGIVDTGDRQRDEEQTRWMRGPLAADAAASEIAVYGIALADEADFQTLQTLAQATAGGYYRAVGADDLSPVFERLLASLVVPEPEPEPEPVTEEVVPAEPMVEEAMAPEPAEIAENELPVEEPAAMPTEVPEQTAVVTEPEPVAETIPPTPLVVAPPVQSQPPASEVDQDWRIWLIIGGVGLLILIALVILLRRPKTTAVKAESTPAGPKAPEMTLHDPDEVSGESERVYREGIVHVGREPEGFPPEQALVIPELTISRRHALFEYRDHGWWLRDLESANGTTLNGKPIERSVSIHPGDRIRFDTFEFIIGGKPGADGFHDTLLHPYDQTVVRKPGEMPDLGEFVQTAKLDEPAITSAEPAAASSETDQASPDSPAEADVTLETQPSAAKAEDLPSSLSDSEQTVPFAEPAVPAQGGDIVDRDLIVDLGDESPDHPATSNGAHSVEPTIMFDADDMADSTKQGQDGKNKA